MGLGANGTASTVAEPDMFGKRKPLQMHKAEATLCHPAPVALEMGIPDSSVLLLTLQLLRESEGPKRAGRNLSNHPVQWFGSSDPWGYFGNTGRGEIFDCHND